MIPVHDDVRLHIFLPQEKQNDAHYSSLEDGRVSIRLSASRWSTLQVAC